MAFSVPGIVNVEVEYFKNLVTGANKIQTYRSHFLLPLSNIITHFLDYVNQKMTFVNQDVKALVWIVLTM